MAGKPRKRQRGEGSVYPDGASWIAAIHIDGRLIKRRAPDRKTAEAKLKELQELRDRQINIGRGEQSLANWLTQWFTDVVTQKALRPRTQEHYRSMIERYILPHLGEKRLCDIRPDHIQQAIIAIRDDIREHTSYDGGRTAHGAADILRQALDLAEQRKLIRESPYRGILLPRYTSADIQPLEDADLTALLTAAQGQRLEALWYAYGLLGVRRGEGLGLMWADLDWNAATLRIERQVQVVKVDGKDTPTLVEPKTRAGKRLLPVPASLLSRLQAHWDLQQAERKARDIHWQEHGLMFASTTGGLLWPRNVERVFYTLRSNAGLPETIKLHHLRHTVATLLDEVGATEALKMGILGHEGKTITQRYTHARTAAMRQVLESLSIRILQQAA